MTRSATARKRAQGIAALMASMGALDEALRMERQGTAALLAREAERAWAALGKGSAARVLV